MITATFRSSIVERLCGIFERYKKRALPIVFCRTPAKRTTPKKIAETATAQGISLNQWVNQALSREVIA